MGIMDEFYKRILLLVGVVMLIGAGITFGIMKLTQKREIVVNTPLRPDLRIQIKNGKADTLYVYKIK